MSDIQFSGPESHVGSSVGQAVAAATMVLRYAVLVGLAIFLILVLLPVALAAAGTYI